MNDITYFDSDKELFEFKKNIVLDFDHFNSLSYNERLALWYKLKLWKVEPFTIWLNDDRKECISILPSTWEEKKLYFLRRAELYRTEIPKRVLIEEKWNQFLMDLERVPQTAKLVKIERRLNEISDMYQTCKSNDKKSPFSFYESYVKGYDSVIERGGELLDSDYNEFDYVAYFLDGQIAALFEDKLKIHLKELKSYNPTIEIAEKVEKWNLKERFYMLKEIGISNFIKNTTEFSQVNKHKILSDILKCDVRTAQDLIDETRKFKISEEETERVKNYFNAKRIKPE